MKNYLFNLYNLILVYINYIKLYYTYGTITPTLVDRARVYAIMCHKRVNQKYDGNKPYKYHLQMVYNYGLKFSYLIPDLNEREIFLAGLWVHDVIEDTGETFNDVAKVLNKDIAEFAYALTNEKGKNRDERANDKYYNDMKLVNNAPLGKVCDRLANFDYGVLTGSSMLKKYIKETPSFIGKLYHQAFHVAFKLLELKVKLANFKNANLNISQSFIDKIESWDDGGFSTGLNGD
jgi:(p)ppGpp synthase/HD superfamily hydrolase